ncbi:hypothetical protein KCU62_g9214, partial [Aureobasidium sp. EXF-3399]
MAINKKSIGSIFNNPGFFRLRDSARGTGNDTGNASDIEMNPMGAQAANTQQEQDVRPEPKPRRKLDMAMSYHRPLFTIALAIGLAVTATCLFGPYEGSQAFPKAEWTREGSVEKLKPKQVIFASLPKRLIWARFFALMSVQVAILEMVYSYASAASGTNTAAKIMRMIQMLFFVVAAVALGICMWGWLLFFI